MDTFTIMAIHKNISKDTNKNRSMVLHAHAHIHTHTSMSLHAHDTYIRTRVCHYTHMKHTYAHEHVITLTCTHTYAHTRTELRKDTTVPGWTGFSCSKRLAALCIVCHIYHVYHSVSRTYIKPIMYLSFCVTHHT